MGKRNAIVEIAQIIDKYKIEDSERGRLCRQFQYILLKNNCIKNVSIKRLKGQI